MGAHGGIDDDETAAVGRPMLLATRADGPSLGDVLERVAEEAGAERAKPDDQDFDATSVTFLGALSDDDPAGR